ncbi:MAG: N-acetylmuramoyl-L-alanine amidase [Bacteroidia bacterium]
MKILKISIIVTCVSAALFAGYKSLKDQYIISKGGLLKYDRAEIYIQAGHEGRTKGSTGTSSKYGNEIDWTPVVADEATRILKEAGISVIRSDADRRKYSVVDLALSIHFDGCEKQCATGASIGYDDITDKPAADEWKAYYSTFFKHKWHKDNFTKNLRYYYNFKYTITKDAELVLELGDLTCPEQAQWMKNNLKNLGHIVAYFAAKRIGKEHLIEEPKIV